MTDGSELEGATQLPEDGVECATPGEFAALWNRRNEEQRLALLMAMRDTQRIASRCLIDDHQSASAAYEQGFAAAMEIARNAIASV